MNAQYFDRARSAYRAGDYSAAAQMFLAAKDPGELAGEADHLRGNSLMKLGLFSDAAQAYADALEDTSYGKSGALLTNQGKAYAASGDLHAAVDSFTAATKDASYATPYKAFIGLANAQMKLGNVAEAGVAFRSAAIDGTNPAPASALASLGDCFVKLGRPADAVESYLTALDYVGAHDDPRAIEANLGCAYQAAGRSADAVDSFNRATSDGIYQLTAEQSEAFAAAREAAVAQRQIVNATGSVPVTAADPLDPMGATGNFMPDPSDTGFFTMTESEMIQEDKRRAKVRRKHRHTGLKVFIVIVLLLLIAGGALGFLYTRGFGFPSQQDAVSGLLTAVAEGGDTDQYLSPRLSEDNKNRIVSTIEGIGEATAEVSGLDAGMTESDATVTVSLAPGGTLTYEVHFVRSDNHIGWAIESFEPYFGDVDESGSSDTGAADVATDATVDPGSAA
ncbi:tetratricopeptide repeat protein [Collinsella tanakaei]|uniref:tetratricopeptide repeat protein n=1 Tax=Collinsella tanakaei TaxID=626935 RepID=UPI0025A3EC12|nr:tetratricopeptide repeat protein [Collinsella tanakaei]MDM8301300.1 tetratricopeptide repeat protein [Collinsella tanakaei]